MKLTKAAFGSASRIRLAPPSVNRNGYGALRQQSLSRCPFGDGAMLFRELVDNCEKHPARCAIHQSLEMRRAFRLQRVLTW